MVLVYLRVFAAPFVADGPAAVGFVAAVVVAWLGVLHPDVLRLFDGLVDGRGDDHGGGAVFAHLGFRF